MLPNRQNQVVQALLAAGVILTAVFASITATNGTFTNATVTNLTATTEQATTINSTTASTTNLTVGQGQNVDKILSGTTTIDPNSLANLGVSTSSNVTVTGAVAGDSVFLTLPTAWQSSTSSALVVGYISAADTLTVWFRNTSSTALDLVSAPLRYDVISH